MNIVGNLKGKNRENSLIKPFHAGKPGHPGKPLTELIFVYDRGAA